MRVENGVASHAKRLNGSATDRTGRYKCIPKKYIYYTQKQNLNGARIECGNARKCIFGP